MRQLKHHEKKLLKKVNFLQYRNEGNLRELQVMRRYHITNRDDYAKYNRITGQITSFVNTLKKLDAKDTVRIDLTDRLAVVMVRNKMSETMREAVTFVEQGHVRVGPETVTDPAYLVTRGMEDFVSWVDTSKVKRKVMRYNDRLDDFDLL
jgi:U3 small nucleolar ribonucleoprotein protein IMP3